MSGLEGEEREVALVQYAVLTTLNLTGAIVYDEATKLTEALLKVTPPEAAHNLAGLMLEAPIQTIDRLRQKASWTSSPYTQRLSVAVASYLEDLISALRSLINMKSGEFETSAASRAESDAMVDAATRDVRELLGLESPE